MDRTGDKDNPLDKESWTDQDSLPVWLSQAHELWQGHAVACCPCLLSILHFFSISCLLHPGLAGGPPSPPPNTDVVQDVGGGSKTWQIFLGCAGAYAQSPPECPKMAKGTLNHAEAMSEVFFPAAHMPCVELHEPGENREIWVPGNEGWDDDSSIHFEIGGPGDITSVLHHLGKGGVAEYPGIADTVHLASDGKVKCPWWLTMPCSKMEKNPL